MTRTSVAAAPVLPEPALKWKREYAAFVKLLPGLRQSHFGKFVAIHEGKVVASADDEVAAALKAFDAVGDVDIHVGLVNDSTIQVARSGIVRNGNSWS